MRTASRLILFDVDGTLIHSGRAGVRGMDAAFHALYGVTGAMAGVSLAGRTDRAIVSDVLRKIGREPTMDAVIALRHAYVDHLAVELTRPVGPSEVLPGVSAILDALDGRDDVAVGLLTGNFERGAAIKLGHFQLWDRFAFGGFGDDHTNRRDLLPLALERAKAAGVNVPPSHVIVVGDTPLDVDCAKAHGAQCVAVATGPFSREQLAGEQPELVLKTLEDTATFFKWLG